MLEIDHCLIHVSDWDRANAFYAGVLGAEVVPRGTGFAYRFGGQQVNCHGPEKGPRPRVDPGDSDLCFRWPRGLAEIEAHLAAHGVEVELGPVARLGARGTGLSLYVRDPDGALIELIVYPS